MHTVKDLSNLQKRVLDFLDLSEDERTPGLDDPCEESGHIGDVARCCYVLESLFYQQHGNLISSVESFYGDESLHPEVERLFLHLQELMR